MRAVVAGLVIVVCACTEPPPDVPQACGAELRSSIVVVERAPIDLLLVVDRTPSMADQADDLRANLRAFATVLSSIGGGLSDLHLAVITTDLGGVGVPGCTARGDAGAFVDAQRCGIDGTFLRDDGRGGRNHDGFADAFACLGEPPLSTCPVNQPFAAIIAALDGSVARNDGFRRPHAQLTLVIISDSDDCSLLDPDALAGVTGEPAVDYTCHTLGPSLADLDATLQYLRTTVEGARGLLLATITGSADVRIGPGPSLAPVCDGARIAGPAPRLHAAELPDLTTRTDLCTANWADALSEVAMAPLFPPLYHVCISPSIDLVPEVPGLQVDCVATLLDLDHSPLEPLGVVPACSDPTRDPDAPCIRFALDPEACADGIRATLAHEPGSLPLRTQVDLRCAAACEPT